MEFVALQILLWDDDDCNEVGYGVPGRLVRLHEHGSAGRHSGAYLLNNLIYRFQIRGSGVDKYSAVPALIVIFLQ